MRQRRCCRRHPLHLALEPPGRGTTASTPRFVWTGLPAVLAGPHHPNNQNPFHAGVPLIYLFLFLLYLVCHSFAGLEQRWDEHTSHRPTVVLDAPASFRPVHQPDPRHWRRHRRAPLGPRRRRHCAVMRFLYIFFFCCGSFGGGLAVSVFLSSSRPHARAHRHMVNHA